MEDFHMDGNVEEPEDDYQYCPNSGMPYRECGCDDCSHDVCTIVESEAIIEDDLINF